VEALDQIMKRSALPEIAELLQRRHEAEGVTFHMATKVAALSGDGHVDGVTLEDGRTIAADVVMIGVGVRPDLRWLEGSDVETQRGVRVAGSCRTSVEHVYAAGDVAELRHPLLDGWQVLESVQNAVSQGKIVAAGILGKKEIYTEAPWFWSEQYDCRLQMAGIPREDDRHVRRDNAETGGMSVFSLSDSRLNAVQSVNSPRDYMVGRQMITHEVDVSEEILADQKFNLKDLL
jgi:3-phenylpropionate/trans-cinnamate dioxygenase ferredoxin reductase subunit